jgi:hypothetical protein
MKKTVQTSLVALATLAACTSAQAQLVMTINTAAKTVSLSGSASGTCAPFGGDYGVAWKLNGTAGDPSQSLGIDSTWYSMSPGSPLADSINVGGGAGGPYSVNLALLADAANQTISGLGVPFSYSGLTSGNQALLESLIGQTMSLDQGSGFGGISVVPEPHEYAAMAALGLIGFAGFRRWRQRA